jgi:His-Xaa-Ser system radical SAM maturase HxsC
MWLDAIPLMPTDTPELGISGGEPTLVPDGLLRVILACRNYLPQTYLQVLTNGRLFTYLSYCQKVAGLKHPGLAFGVPLYSDLAYLHDHIVQSEGAFDQTLRGIMNLKRCGQRVELRVVLMRQTIERLGDLAYFITRNLPFVEHVALMGLEPMGRAATSWNNIWVDPADYQESLLTAVDTLASHRLPVSIYNHQLCVLDRRLWPFARKSISDWKTEYFDECRCCCVRHDCGGFFASSRKRHSRAIVAVTTVL